MSTIKAAFCNVQSLPDNRSIYITQEGRKGAGAKISFLPVGAMQAANLISLLADLPIDKGVGA